MKTVSGEVVSTKPVSLSKAAKILSNFASSDNGASPAYVAYLKRASASFDELAQLHKKYKKSGDEHKIKSSKERKILQEASTKIETNISAKNLVEIEENRGVKKAKEEADAGKKHKSKKRSKNENAETSGEELKVKSSIESKGQTEVNIKVESNISAVSDVEIQKEKRGVKRSKEEAENINVDEEKSRKRRKDEKNHKSNNRHK